MLPVNELFYSIQGEGDYTGHPAAFIRMQGCPVGCSFCDTKHTWIRNKLSEVDKSVILNDEDRPKEAWAYLTSQDLVDWVVANSNPEAIVVVTGGEPLMYQEVVELAERLLGLGRKVQFETSGTYDLPDLFAMQETYDFDLSVTVSPKWNGNKEVLEHVVRQAAEVKVVISDERIIQRVEEGLHRGLLNVETLRLQPETGENFGWSSVEAVRLCKQYGCKLSLQTHTFLAVR